MASNKTNNPARRGAARAKKGGKRAAPQSRPIHREVAAFCCLGLGFFLVLSWFGAKGFFIEALRVFARGLVGSGFYVLTLAFLAAFFILLLHNGHPVCLRLICLFFLPAGIGALGYLFSKSHFSWSGAIISTLYRFGVNNGACGLFSGLIGMLLESVIGRVGAAVVLLLLLALALLGAANMSVFSLARAIQNRPRLPKYDPPEEPPVDRAAQLVNHVQNKRIERAERAERRRADAFDLPVDDPPRPVRRREPKPEAPPRVVQSPGNYLLEQRREAARRARETGPLEDIGEVREQAPEKLEVVPPAPEPAGKPVPDPIPAAPEPVPFPTAPAPEPSAPAAAPAEDGGKKSGEAEPDVPDTLDGALATPPELYVFPPASLLRAPEGGSIDGTEEMRENTDRLNATLQSFNIDAHIVNVIRGPSVTRYELELDRGVKLSKVTNLSDDIALSLGASGVRISAIPDKISVVGIEVPNRLVSTVLARDVIDSVEFQSSKSKISFAVGKDISGNRIVGDIAKLPHLLIAGTTGSGKSVCMNSLIISLLYKARPNEVRLIMVDPKMVELGVYNGIPHLLIPVVTDPKKAAGALQWAVNEMLRRYRLMADAGVRDLDSYNRLSVSEDGAALEQIVVVIDELADLMLVAAKEVEESICRIAQMGRASGIHLVIATQRPSADVITGLMKANIPSRIAFAVASAMESRIILDTQGAEKLVGKGDMLYAPLGQGKPKRVQGCFISDAEVQQVVRFIKKTSAPNYSEEVRSQIEEGGGTGGEGGGQGAAASESNECDELLPAAVDVILETGQASVSMLQRRLKLGYARAARIVDEMEERGIVGPFEGSKPRQLLITREEWELQKQGGAPAAPDNPE